MSSYDYRNTPSAKLSAIVDIDSLDFFKEHIKSMGDVAGSKNKFKFDEEAIQELLTSYFGEIEKTMEQDSATFSVGYFTNGDLCYIGRTTKAIFVNDINKLYKSGKLKNVPDIDTKMSKLLNYINLTKVSFPEDYVVRIDDQNVKIKTKTILDFINGGYRNVDFKNSNWNIDGLNRDKFCYVVKDFIARNMVLEKYALTESTYKTLNDIATDVLANTVQFNRHMTTNDDYVLSFELNKELESLILQDMPQNYSDLEKAIYIYIKLCKHLTYDPEFYANNQSGMVAREHEDISRLSTVSASKRNIVCYEFTQLYAKFLFNMGINYSIDGGMEYGDAHTSLDFRVGDFLINADSVTNILGGDLYNAKTNSELVGLVCKNKHLATKNEFNKLYRSVYLKIANQEQEKKTDEEIFADFVDMFTNLCKQEMVPFDKKIKIIEKQLQDATLPIMEKLVYGLRLSKAVFKSERKQNQFDVTIIGKKQFQGFFIKTMPVLVLSFNEDSFTNNPQGTKYMIVGTDGKAVPIERKEIIESFQSGMFKHITRGVQDKHVIPGIDSAEGGTQCSKV